MRVMINGHEQETSQDMNVSRLLDERTLQPLRVAVEINERLIPRAKYESTYLQENDIVEIVTFVGGG